MKKIILLVFCNLVFLLNAQDWNIIKEKTKYTKFTEKTYKTREKTIIYSSNGNEIGVIDSNKIFVSGKFALAQNEGISHIDTVDYMVGYENGWISSKDIVLENSAIYADTISNDNITKYEKEWIPIWYNSIISSDKLLEDFSCDYELYKDSEEFVLSCIHNIEFKNIMINIYSVRGQLNFQIIKNNKINNIYATMCELAKNEQVYFNELLSHENFFNLPDLTENRNCTFIIEQNGNRLRLYNGENYKLIIELMKTDKSWNDSMIKYIESDYKDKPLNLVPIEEKLEHPWSDPKTGLYEGTFDAKSLVAVQSTNVAQNKTMTVKENLKLRSGEATTSEVITVMSAGTKVKILELGKAENIDGISSNWVKVEVLSGAKDRDGKLIKTGTIGWCYGGYLK